MRDPELSELAISTRCPIIRIQYSAFSIQPVVRTFAVAAVNASLEVVTVTYLGAQMGRSPKTTEDARAADVGDVERASGTASSLDALYRNIDY